MIGTVLDYSILIPILPFISFAIIGLFVSGEKHKTAYTISISVTTVCLLLTILVGSVYFGEAAAKHADAVTVGNWPWLVFSSGIYPQVSSELVVNVGILLDPISIVLAFLVCTVSLLAQIYSVGYLHGDSGVRRFFAYMSLFTGAMLSLVLAKSLLQIFVFWELVGLGSFLLIGYYYNKKSAVSACKKAFIVTRFADLGFLIGVLLLSSLVGTFDILEIEKAAASVDTTLLGIACLLITMGAFGKSAMFPLHIWLPDAMEGPTPVSALLHAATMVVAGVYLVARLFGVFVLAGFVLPFIAYVGVFTALFAAIIACTQTDIKRVLAYSTLSQIGYMMLALGACSLHHTSGYTASMFHLTTHAFFKALLFLGAGSVIHAVASNEMGDMGGLRKKMPITHWTFLIGCLAISALPPYLVSGFFSKEEIFLSLMEGGHTSLLGIAILVAGLTSFYMFRIYYLTFWNKDSERLDQAHESPLSMTMPLVILAVLSVIAGWIPFKDYVFWKGAHAVGHHEAGIGFIALTVLVGLAGWFIAHRLYFRKRDMESAFFRTGIFKLIKNKFYIDEIYLFVVKQIIFKWISRPLEWFDKKIVDGNMDNVAFTTHGSAEKLKYLSSGQLHLHILAIVAGIFCFIVLVGMMI